jgi:uncharacterized protein YidB (DUF937 family)
MTMFDSIIAEANERFDLDGKAGTLLSALLALMTDETRGGLKGFTEKFNRAGFGDTVSSWINSSDANTEISGKQIESALGIEALQKIANQTGINYESAVSATSFMTPRVVDAVTPGGAIPADGDLMSRVGRFFTEATAAPSTVAATTTAETFDRIGTAAAETPDPNKNNFVGADVAGSRGETYPLGNRVDAALENIDDAADNPSPLQWLLPLLLLGLLLIIGYWACSQPPTASAAVNISIGG